MVSVHSLKGSSKRSNGILILYAIQNGNLHTVETASSDFNSTVQLLDYAYRSFMQDVLGWIYK